MADYIIIDSPAGLSAALEASHREPVVLFKHSTRCSISTLAKSRVDQALRSDELGAPVFYLDLIANRDISDAIAKQLGVRHESPQAIVVKDGVATYVATHLDIDPYAFKLN